MAAFCHCDRDCLQVCRCRGTCLYTCGGHLWGEVRRSAQSFGKNFVPRVRGLTLSVRSKAPGTTRKLGACATNPTWYVVLYSSMQSVLVVTGPSVDMVLLSMTTALPWQLTGDTPSLQPAATARRSAQQHGQPCLVGDSCMGA